MIPDYARYKYLSIQCDNGIATLMLNQPDNRNAIHAEMHAELEQVWLDLQADPQVLSVLRRVGALPGNDVLVSKGHEGVVIARQGESAEIDAEAANHIFVSN